VDLPLHMLTPSCSFRVYPEVPSFPPRRVPTPTSILTRRSCRAWKTISLSFPIPHPVYLGPFSPRPYHLLVWPSIVFFGFDDNNHGFNCANMVRPPTCLGALVLPMPSNPSQCNVSIGLPYPSTSRICLSCHTFV